MHLQLLQKKVIQRRAEAASNLIGDKIADKITRVWKISPQNNSRTNWEKILIEIYMSPEERQKIVDNLRLIR